MELTLWPRTKRLQAEVDKLSKELTEVRQQTLNNSWNLKEIVWGSQSSVNVTKSTALTLSAVYSALNILSDTLNIPVYVYKRLANGDKQLVPPEDSYEYQVFRLLHVSTSQLHTPAEFFSIMEATRYIYGNSYAYVLRDNLGMPRALKYVHPDYVDVEFDGVQIWYNFRDEQGNIIIRRAEHWNVFHMKAFSRDGIIGVSPIDLAAESLGFGKATQKQGNKYFEDGMMNKVVLSHPGSLSEKGEKNLKESFDKKLTGSGTVVLEEGIKVYPLSITNEQSQFLQSREFSVTEVARWFNIPEFMLANNDPTYSNIENFANHFITHNVRPRVRQWEQQLNKVLLGNVPDYYTEFNMDALVRADLKTQAEYFVRATGGNSWMTRNEVRSLKNMNKDIDSGRGDSFLEPLNAATEAEREMEDNDNGQGNEDIQ